MTTGLSDGLAAGAVLGARLWAMASDHGDPTRQAGIPSPFLARKPGRLWEGASARGRSQTRAQGCPWWPAANRASKGWAQLLGASARGCLCHRSGPRREERGAGGSPWAPRRELPVDTDMGKMLL